MDGGNGTDLFGFSSLPGGGRDSWGGGFGNDNNGFGINGLWWTTTLYGSDNIWYRHIDHDVSKVRRYNVSKLSGNSVRCLRD